MISLPWHVLLFTFQAIYPRYWERFRAVKGRPMLMTSLAVHRIQIWLHAQVANAIQVSSTVIHSSWRAPHKFQVCLQDSWIVKRAFFPCSRTWYLKAYGFAEVEIESNEGKSLLEMLDKMKCNRKSTFYGSKVHFPSLWQLSYNEAELA